MEEKGQTNVAENLKLNGKKVVYENNEVGELDDNNQISVKLTAEYKNGSFKVEKVEKIEPVAAVVKSADGGEGMSNGGSRRRRHSKTASRKQGGARRSRKQQQK